MKEYLSAGTYIEQRDQSFLPTGEISEAASVFIGGFAKGKAFIPMLIKDGPDLISKTGQPNGKFYAQYAALQYSKHASNFWVQRLLWQSGYKSDALIIFATGSGYTLGGDVLAVLASAGPNNGTTSNALSLGASGSATGSAGVLSFSVTGTCSAGAVTAAYTISKADITNIQYTFGATAQQYTSPVYLYAKMHDTTSIADATTVSIVRAADFLNFTTASYKHAVTPWITDVNGGELFRIHHSSDGTYTNRDIKIEIKNIVTSSTAYTVFDLLIRQYDDTERKPYVYEAYYSLNLDPTSDNYIAKRIGDVWTQYDATRNKLRVYGDYANVSKYVRVEVSTAVKNAMIGKTTNINNVQRIPVWYTSNSLYVEDYPTASIYTANTTTTTNTFNGYDVAKNSITALSMPVNGATTPTTTGSVIKFANNTRYIVPFYGGFDGRNPAGGYSNNTGSLNGFDMSSTTAAGVESYKKALDIIINPDEFNIDVISIAGANLQSTGKAEVYRYALEDICQERGEVIVVGDLAETDTIDTANTSVWVTPFDSSYGAVYFPSVKYYDGYTKTYPVLPVSSLIPAVIAYTKKVSQPYYAPAGIDRGTLNVVQAMSKLNKTERDLLYSYNVNPIASFAGTGTVVWGQKTLQKLASALDRLNGRLLTNQIKKWIDAYGRSLLFNNNTVNLRQVFSLGAATYLDQLVAGEGLYEYKFLMDETNNTAETIDRNQLIGELWIKITKTTQFIIIPINIVRTDAVL